MSFQMTLTPPLFSVISTMHEQMKVSGKAQRLNNSNYPCHMPGQK